jgi:hypothetical protein
LLPRQSWLALAAAGSGRPAFGAGSGEAREVPKQGDGVRAEVHDRLRGGEEDSVKYIIAREATNTHEVQGNNHEETMLRVNQRIRTPAINAL